jgi:DNA-binding response OmpR family regulator/cellulose synthase/poly-beta-1,6-N-acetylglucosamine synthase-like glycosyltransferase
VFLGDSRQHGKMGGQVASDGVIEARAVSARVLVVDDDESVRRVVQFALEEAGHEVVVAEDGAEALVLLDDTSCDLVIADLTMPRLDGLGLVERLRSAEATRSIPIVLMTGRDGPEDAVRALRAGADDYVRKPFDMHELVARVQAKLERPPVQTGDLTDARRVGVLTAQRIGYEVDRELARAARSGRPLAVGVMTFAEHDIVVKRFGRHAGVDLLRLAAQAAQAAASPVDLAGLTSVNSGANDGLVLLMPETGPEQAARRLAKVGAVLAATPFSVRGENLHVTPITGWTTSTPPPGDGEQFLDRARLAAVVSGDHLDLLPVRWTPALEHATPPRPRRTFTSRLRTPLRILLTFVLGIGVPFAAYVGLYRAGTDISGVMFWVVVGALLITAVLIWLEGFLALRPERPPDRPGAPYPKATALIAAYLPNEAAIILDTLERFLTLDYPGELQVVLAYNTPGPIPIEDQLADLARRDPRFIPYRVSGSTSKAQNINAALAVVDGSFTGVFDADHHPDPDTFERAWRWLSNGYDVAQGHCAVRNGAASWITKTVAVEFEAIYAVSHPGRARLHGFGIFGGSNGFWLTPLLREVRMQGLMLTEDIDSSMRVLLRGRRIVIDPGLVSRELAPTTVRALWRQRMRWAQGWFQVSRRHLAEGWKSPSFTMRNKLGLFVLLGWREIYPWLSLQMFPLIAFLAWREGGVARLDWLIPSLVLLTLFTIAVGPGQALFAYKLAVPELRRKRWFVAYFFTAVIYTEFKNAIARVAQVKELSGEHRWVVTPRTTLTSEAPD